MSERFPDLIAFLPGLYHKGIGEKDDTILYGLLNIFEEVITGSNTPTESRSFAEAIDIVGDIFFPCAGIFSGEESEFSKHFDVSDSDYYKWLASLTGLVLEEDWPVEKKRVVISKIIPLYRMRGTKRGLEEYLNIYVNGEASIVEEQKPMRVEKNSTVGIDTVIGIDGEMDGKLIAEGLPHHFFIVNLTLAITNPKEIKKQIQAVRRILDMEKPVHTDYKINTKTPSMQLEVYSTVEIDTLLSLEI